MNTYQPSKLAMKRSQRITVYPNLVSQKKFWIQLYSIEKCVFTVHLYSLTGQQVFKLFLNHADMTSEHTVHLPQHIQRGIYKVAIRFGEEHHVQPMIIQ
jgi:hypothetical protein